jgi:S1-C subfamily serine protease
MEQNREIKSRKLHWLAGSAYWRIFMKNLTSISMILILLVSGTAYLLAEPETENPTPGRILMNAKKILEKHKDSIVSVRLVVKIKNFIEGRPVGEGEREVHVNGFTVHPSGITVISSSATDPTTAFQSPMAKKGQLKNEVTVVDAKIILSDGTEVPASIVLKDKDLDIAFVKPDKAGSGLPYLKLVKTSTPEVCDPVILISRLDAQTGREPFVVQTAISSIVKKPRTHYRTMYMLDPGLPVFDAEGRCIGVSAISTTGGEALQALIYGSFMECAMGTVLPVSDIMDMMKQLPKSHGE